MSLIERLRASTENTSTRLLLFLAIALFIGVGGKRARGLAGGVAATVDGDAISTPEFREALRAESQRAGAGLTEAERDELANATLENLISQTVILHEADRIGVAVGDVELKRAITQMKMFQVDGKFSEKAYRDGLDKMDKTEAAFTIELRRMLILQKMIDLAGRGVFVTDDEARAVWLEESTTQELAFVRLVPEAFTDSIPVSDADRDAYLAANADKVKSQYDEDYNRLYNVPRRYHLATIVLAADAEGVDRAVVRARAEALRAELLAGRDFAEAATSESADATAADGGEMGVVAAGALDTNLAAAADKAGAGQLTEVVETPRGFTILKVAAIDEARSLTLEQARNDVAVGLLRAERVEGVMQEFAGKLIAAWASAGVPPQADLDAHQLRLDSTGPFSLADTTIPRIGENPEILATLVGRNPGDVLPLPVKVKDALLVLQLAARTEPDEAEYATSGGMVKGRLLYTRKLAFVEAWRKELVSRASITREMHE